MGARGGKEKMGVAVKKRGGCGEKIYPWVRKNCGVVKKIGWLDWYHFLSKGTSDSRTV